MSKVDEARALIVEENKKRSRACYEEIIQVCEKHKCTLTAVPQFEQRGDGFVTVCELRVVAE